MTEEEILWEGPWDTVKASADSDRGSHAGEGDDFGFEGGEG